MKSDKPRWQRRKTARPAEIIAAALTVFAEKGFAAAKLDEIARRAGVAKGSLYLYFETKEDLFRAVAQTAILPILQTIEEGAERFDGHFAELAPGLLSRAVAVADSPLPAVVRMVIGESGNFPDLARIWHDDVVSKIIGSVSRIILRAQARGEVRSGDPRVHAFSLLGPMMMAMLFRDVFRNIAEPIDLELLSAQHARTALTGLLSNPESVKGNDDAH